MKRKMVYALSALFAVSAIMLQVPVQAKTTVHNGKIVSKIEKSVKRLEKNVKNDAAALKGRKNSEKSTETSTPQNSGQ